MISKIKRNLSYCQGSLRILIPLKLPLAHQSRNRSTAAPSLYIYHEKSVNDGRVREGEGDE